MKVSTLFYAVTLVAVSAANQCPKEQEVNWEIQHLLEHRDCDKFYMCVFGQPVEMLCSDGLFYNPALGQCDWKQNVDCGDRNIPDDSPNSGESGVGEGNDEGNADGESGDEVGDICESEQTKLPESEIRENGCPIDASVHWLLAHESDCNKFYYCMNGAKILSNCSDDLHFNSRLQVCDLPQNACCDHSIKMHTSGRRMLMQK